MIFLIPIVRDLEILKQYPGEFQFQINEITCFYIFLTFRTHAELNGKATSPQLS